jgi:hypothetical protein
VTKVEKENWTQDSKILQLQRGRYN